MSGTQNTVPFRPVHPPPHPQDSEDPAPQCQASSTAGVGVGVGMAGRGYRPRRGPAVAPPAGVKHGPLGWPADCLPPKTAPILRCHGNLRLQKEH